MKIKRSFVFAFNDPHALKKLVLGGLFLFGFFTIYCFIMVVGYFMRILFAALEGRDAGLPDWKNYTDLFNEGLLPLLVILAYVSPLIGITILEQMSIAIFYPNLEILSVLLVLKLLLTLAVGLFMPWALIRFIIHGSLREAFNLSKILEFIRTNPKHALTVWGLSVATGLAATIVGLACLVIGIFFTSFVNLVVVAHLHAQAYRESTPFSDDKDGKIRSAVTVPPPLAKKSK